MADFLRGGIDNVDPASAAGSGILRSSFSMFLKIVIIVRSFAKGNCPYLGVSQGVSWAYLRVIPHEADRRS